MPMGYVWSLLSHIQPRATASPNLLLCLDFWILSTESLNLQWQNQFSDIHLASPSLAFSLQSIQSDIYSAMIPDWDCNTKRFWSGASAWHKTNTYLKKVNTYLKPKVLWRSCSDTLLAIFKQPLVVMQTLDARINPFNDKHRPYCHDHEAKHLKVQT